MFGNFRTFHLRSFKDLWHDLPGAVINEQTYRTDSPINKPHSAFIRPSGAFVKRLPLCIAVHGHMCRPSFRVPVMAIRSLKSEFDKLEAYLRFNLILSGRLSNFRDRSCWSGAVKLKQADTISALEHLAAGILNFRR